MPCMWSAGEHLAAAPTRRRHTMRVRRLRADGVGGGVIEQTACVSAIVCNNGIHGDQRKCARCSMRV